MRKIKCMSIYVIGIPEKKRTQEKKFDEIMDKKSPDLMKSITLQIKSVQQTSSRINTKRSTDIYIIVKLLKVKVNSSQT